MLRKRIGIVLVLCLCLAGVGFTAEPGEAVTAVCKVNKGLITVFAGTEPGQVIVAGRAGSITSSSNPVAYLSNTNTGARVDFKPAADMSFTAVILASPGEKIRVNAQNSEGKKSYGTFDITSGLPALTMPPASVVEPPQPNAAVPAIMEYNLPPARDLPNTLAVEQVYEGEMVYNQDEREGTNLAVIIMVVNTDSGQVLATTQVAGKSKTYAEKSEKNFGIMIDRIIDRCKSIIKSEIFRPDLDRTTIPQSDTATADTQ